MSREKDIQKRKFDIAQIRDLCYSQRKRKGYVLCRGPKRSALEVNKEKLAAVEEKLAKLEETVKALKAEKKELAAEIRKAELSELLDAIEESNLSVNDVHEFIKQNSEQK